MLAQASSGRRDTLAHARLSATPRTAARQAPLSTRLSRQEDRSGLPCLLQGIFMTQGPNPRLLHWRAGSLPPSPLGSPSLYQPVYYPSVTSNSLSHLLTICQSRYVSSTCLLSSYHLCVNKSIYLSLVISARLSFIHQHICYLFISPSITFLSIIYISILEKEMAAHSSTLAWKIPWTEEPHKLQSMGSQRVSHD